MHFTLFQIVGRHPSEHQEKLTELQDADGVYYVDGVVILCKCMLEAMLYKSIIVLGFENSHVALNLA